MKKSVSEDERAWFIFRKGDEREDGDRVSFPRWGKRNVVSFHFTEFKKNHGFGDASYKRCNLRMEIL